MARSHLVAGLAAYTTMAAASWIPAETPSLAAMADMSYPMPTSAPEAGKVEELLKRQRGDNTCAFVSGDADATLECNPNAGSCVVDNFRSVIGCCNSADVADCSIATTCIDRTDSSLISTNDGRIYYCSGINYPSCVTYTFDGSLYNDHTIFGCGIVNTVVAVYANPTGSAPTSSSGTRIASSATSPEPSSTLIPTNPDDDDDDDDDDSDDDDDDDGDGDDGGDDFPVGAVVGGAVGGVAVLALIAFGVFFILRKKKKKVPSQPTTYTGPAGPTNAYDAGKPPMFQASSPVQPGPSPTGFPPGFVGVDNHNGMMKPPAWDPNQQPSYDRPPTVSPPPPSQSPPMAYHPSGVPSSIGSPDPYTAAYSQPPPPPPPQQQQQQQPVMDNGGYQAYNPTVAAAHAPPPPQQQHYQHHAPPPPQHQQGFAAELPTERGDRQLQELA